MVVAPAAVVAAVPMAAFPAAMVPMPLFPAVPVITVVPTLGIGEGGHGGGAQADGRGDSKQLSQGVLLWLQSVNERPRPPARRSSQENA